MTVSVLILGGGIGGLSAAHELVERGFAVRCVMTKAAQEFITPLAVGAISNERVATDLFDLEAVHLRGAAGRGGRA